MNALAAISPLRAFLIGLCVGLAYWLAIYDDGGAIVQSTESMKKQYEAEARKLRRLEQEAKTYQKYETLKKILGSTVKELESYVPKESSAAAMQEVSQAARGVGLSIGKINKDSEKKIEGAVPYVKVLISMDLTGEYHRFMNFLSRLSYIKKIFIIDKIKMKRATKDEGKIEVDITLAVYRHVAGKAGAKGGSGASAR